MDRTTVPTSNEATLLRSAITSETMERDRLAQILDEYLAAIEQGASITPERLLAQHPVDAEKLRMYLQGLEIFHAAARSESIIVPRLDSGLDADVEREAADVAPQSNPASSVTGTRSRPRLLI